jgi:hypothetical protein
MRFLPAYVLPLGIFRDGGAAVLVAGAGEGRMLACVQRSLGQCSESPDVRLA